MIKIFLPAFTACSLIGCGGDKPESTNTRQIKTPSSSSSLAQSKAVGTSAVGGNPMVAPVVIRPHGPAEGGPPKSGQPKGGLPKGASPGPVTAHSSAGPAAPIQSPHAPIQPAQGPLPSPPQPAPSPSSPPSPVDSVEVEFMDEFDDGEPHNRRQVPERPSPTGTYNSNIVGEAVLQLINDEGGVTVDYVIEELITLLAMSVDRNTGLFNNDSNHMQWWAESRGPELLQHVTANPDCGIGVVDANSAKTKCYLLMMIGTHAPVQADFKPRDVAVDIGLWQWCEGKRNEIANELQLRATQDPAPFDGWYHHPNDGLPDDSLTNYQVTTRSISNAFAATWLSFCPNLVKVTGAETRLMVFKHAMFRMQIASLHADGRNDPRYRNPNVNRATAFTDLVNGDGLLTERIQRLRRPMLDVRFREHPNSRGPGVLEAFASEVGKQIFTYTLPTEGGVGGEPDRVLFQYPQNNEYVFIKEQALIAAGPRRSRPVVERYYKAAGRFVGWMLINRKPIPEDLSLMFFARLMDRKIGWEAIKVYDAVKYRMFSTCFSGTAREIETVGCTYLNSFAINYKNEHGDPLDSWPDTREERRHRLNDITTNLVTSESEEEFQIFSQGIYDVVPKHIFECGITTKDLRLLIVGARTVDAEELKDNLRFSGSGYNAQSPQIEWLKGFIISLNQKQLQAFVEFTTGRRRPGPGGFRAEPIDVIRMPIQGPRDNPNDPQLPPKSHTCFRQLELPPYRDVETLIAKMAWALEDGEFGMD
jgi:hypothetical protein